MEGIHIFVYGSLRKGLQNHGKLDTAKYSGDWKTVDKYFMIGLKSGAYPYVTTEQLNDSLLPTQIHGEMYIVSPQLLEVLDELEGHPYQYKRRIIDVENSKKETTHAHMYILESDDIKDGIQMSFHRRFVAVNDGDWVKHLN